MDGCWWTGVGRRLMVVEGGLSERRQRGRITGVVVGSSRRNPLPRWPVRCSSTRTRTWAGFWRAGGSGSGYWKLLVQDQGVQGRAGSKVGRDSASQRKSKRTTCAQWSAYNRGEAAWLSRKAQTERILSNELLSLTLSCRPPKYKHIEEGEEIEEFPSVRAEHVGAEIRALGLGDSRLLSLTSSEQSSFHSFFSQMLALHETVIQVLGHGKVFLHLSPFVRCSGSQPHFCLCSTALCTAMYCRALASGSRAVEHR
jgi:hypothetical protein